MLLDAEFYQLEPSFIQGLCTFDLEIQHKTSKGLIMQCNLIYDSYNVTFGKWKYKVRQPPAD